MSELGVLIPTRARPHNIEPILRAWAETGAYGAATPIFVIDKDDAKFDEYKRILTRPGVETIARDQWAPLVPKLNDAAVCWASRFPFLAFMGDDHIPRTPMWAHKLVEAHVVSQAGIVYGRDGLQDERLCTWWSMDSRIVRSLGRMVPAPVQHMYCDNAVKALGEKAHCLWYRSDILIEHMHPIAGKAPADEQYARVNRPEQYARDYALFRQWEDSGLAEDAILLSGIWR